MARAALRPAALDERIRVIGAELLESVPLSALTVAVEGEVTKVVAWVRREPPPPTRHGLSRVARAWGRDVAITFHRDAERPFSEEERLLLTLAADEVVSHAVQGVRLREQLEATCSTATGEDALRTAEVLLGDDGVQSASRAWELLGGVDPVDGHPADVLVQATRTLRASGGAEVERRLPLRAGGWLRLVVRPIDGALVAASLERLDPAATATGLERLEPGVGRVASLVAAGLSNQEIARRLSVGVHTVKRLVSRALRGAGVRRRAELVARLHGTDGRTSEGGGAPHVSR